MTIYESHGDREKQLSIAGKMEKSWKVNCISTPTLSSIDFILYDENKEIKAIAEVKDRDINKYKYDTFFISENKIKHGLSISETLKVPLLLVVQWKDQLGWTKVKSLDEYEVKVGGRLDRGSANDIERLVHIDVNKFKSL